MGQSWNFSQQGALGGGGELSPGSNSTGFSSRTLVFGDSAGRLTNNSSAPWWDSVNNRLGIRTTAPAQALDVAGSVVIASPNNTTILRIDGTTAGTIPILVIESTGSTSKIGFWGATPATRAPAYTTAANTTNRVFPTTASLSTFTGVAGLGCAFTSRADMEAFVQVVAQMHADLKALGILA